MTCRFDKSKNFIRAYALYLKTKGNKDVYEPTEEFLKLLAETFDNPEVAAKAVEDYVGAKNPAPTGSLTPVKNVDLTGNYRRSEDSDNIASYYVGDSGYRRMISKFRKDVLGASILSIDLNTGAFKFFDSNEIVNPNLNITRLQSNILLYKQRLLNNLLKVVDPTGSEISLSESIDDLSFTKTVDDVLAMFEAKLNDDNRSVIEANGYYDDYVILKNFDRLVDRYTSYITIDNSYRKNKWEGVRKYSLTPKVKHYSGFSKDEGADISKQISDLAETILKIIPEIDANGNIVKDSVIGVDGFNGSMMTLKRALLYSQNLGEKSVEYRKLYSKGAGSLEEHFQEIVQDFINNNTSKPGETSTYSEFRQLYIHNKLRGISKFLMSKDTPSDIKNMFLQMFVKTEPATYRAYSYDQDTEMFMGKDLKSRMIVTQKRAIQNVISSGIRFIQSGSRKIASDLAKKYLIKISENNGVETVEIVNNNTNQKVVLSYMFDDKTSKLKNLTIDEGGDTIFEDLLRDVYAYTVPDTYASCISEVDYDWKSDFAPFIVLAAKEIKTKLGDIARGRSLNIHAGDEIDLKSFNSDLLNIGRRLGVIYGDSIHNTIRNLSGNNLPLFQLTSLEYNWRMCLDDAKEIKYDNPMEFSIFWDNEDLLTEPQRRSEISFGGRIKSPAKLNLEELTKLSIIDDFLFPYLGGDTIYFQNTTFSDKTTHFLPGFKLNTALKGDTVTEIFGSDKTLHNIIDDALKNGTSKITEWSRKVQMQQAGTLIYNILNDYAAVFGWTDILPELADEDQYYKNVLKCAKILDERLKGYDIQTLRNAFATKRITFREEIHAIVPKAKGLGKCRLNETMLNIFESSTDSNSWNQRVEREKIIFKNDIKRTKLYGFTQGMEKQIERIMAIDIIKHDKFYNPITKEYSFVSEDGTLNPIVEVYFALDQILSNQFNILTTGNFWTHTNKNKDGVNSNSTQSVSGEDLYNRLGSKTQSEHVKIVKWGDLKYAQSPIDVNGNIISTRILGGTIESFGNTFTPDPRLARPGMTLVSDTKTAVSSYIQAVLYSDDPHYKWIREQCKSGALKGRNILYYTELNEPSHATALDFLINGFDWNAFEKSQSANSDYLTYSEANRFVNQIKRNVIFGSTIHPFAQGIKSDAGYEIGVTPEINIAIIADQDGLFYTPAGIDTRGDAQDGCGWSTALQSILENNSLIDAKVGDNKKTIVHDIDHKYGAPTLLKWAVYSLTNSVRRNGKQSVANVEDLVYRMYNVRFDSPLDADLNQDYQNFKSKNGPIYIYDLANCVYKEITGVQKNADGTYQTIYADGTTSKPITVNTLYDIDQLFGRAWTFDKNPDGTFSGNEASSYILAEIACKYNLRDKQIAYAVNASGCKVGAANINTKETWTNRSPLRSYKISTKYAGAMMDADHELDMAEVTEMSQMISALAEDGFYTDIVTNIYKEIGEIALNNEKTQKYIRAVDEGNRAKIAELLGKSLIASFQTGNKDTIGLAQAFIRKFDTEYKKAKLAGTSVDYTIPFSDPTIFGAFVADITSRFNKDAIRRKYEGFAGIMNPSYNMMQYYRNANGEVKLFQQFNEECKEKLEPIVGTLPEEFTDWVELANSDFRLLKWSDISGEITFVQNPFVVPYRSRNDIDFEDHIIIIGPDGTLIAEDYINSQEKYDLYKHLMNLDGCTIYNHTAKPKNLRGVDTKLTVKALNEFGQTVDIGTFSYYSIDSVRAALYIQKGIIDAGTYYSGGAVGSDTIWGETISKLGGNVIHYRPNDYDNLSSIEQSRIETEYIQVRSFLGRPVLSSTTRGGKLTRRDMMQADSGDAIFAIARKIIKPGDSESSNGVSYVNKTDHDVVSGGTANAVARGILRNIPVYVFSQEDGYWYKWNKNTNSFIRTSTPTLTKNATTIGTEKINDLGINAIQEVVIKSLNPNNDQFILNKRNLIKKVCGTITDPAEQLAHCNRLTQNFLRKLDQGKEYVSALNRGETVNLSDVNLGHQECFGIVTEPLIYYASDYVVRPAEIIIGRYQFDKLGLTDQDHIWQIKDSSYFYNKLVDQFAQPIFNVDPKVGIKAYDRVLYHKGKPFLVKVGNITHGDDGLKETKCVENNVVGDDLRWESEVILTNETDNEDYFDKFKFTYLEDSDGHKYPTITVQSWDDLEELTDSDFFEDFYRKNAYGRKSIEIQLEEQEKLAQLAETKFEAFKEGLKFVGARIPTQAMQSFIPADVIAVTDSKLNATYFPVSGMLIEGADLDGDKIFLLTCTLLNNGTVRSGSALQKMLGYKTTSRLLKGKGTTFREGENGYPMNGTELAQFLVPTEKWNDATKDAFVYHANKLIEGSLTNGYTDITFVKPEDIDEELFSKQKKRFLDLLNKHSNTKSYIKDSIETLKSRVFSGIRRVTLGAQTQMKAQITVDSCTEEFKDAAINTTGGKTEKTISPFIPSSKYQMQVQGILGKAVVGIGAVSLKTYFILCTAYNRKVLEIVKDLKDGRYDSAEEILKSMVITNPFTGESTTLSGTNLDKILEIEDKVGEWSRKETFFNTIRTLKANSSKLEPAESLSSIVSLSADNMKDLALPKLNATEDLVDIYTTAFMIGIPFREISKVMTSPIFTMLTEFGKDNIFDSYTEGIRVKDLISDFLSDTSERKVAEKLGNIASRYNSFTNEVLPNEWYFNNDLIDKIIHAFVKEGGLIDQTPDYAHYDETADELDQNGNPIVVQKSVKSDIYNLYRYLLFLKERNNFINDRGGTLNIYAGTGENADLSNFAKRPFEIIGMAGVETRFNTVEGAFQAAKLAYTDLSMNKIVAIEQQLQTATGKQAREIGQSIPNLDRKQWDANSSRIMKELIKASFEQNPQALKRLLDTKDAILTHTQGDKKWREEFPRILMEVREELRSAYDKSSTDKNFNGKGNDTERFATPEESAETISSQKTILSNEELQYWNSQGVGEMPRILVASERTDPAFHTQEILDILDGKKTANEWTIVDGKRVPKPLSGKDFAGLYLITKHDGLPIKQLLETDIPKLIHFSITTLGGTKYEPGVMKYNDLLDRISEYIEQGLDPNCITIRIDPIVPGITKTEDIENVVRRASEMGIKRIRFSIMDAYKNTRISMEKLGYNFEEHYGDNFFADEEYINDICDFMLMLKDKYGVTLGTCAESIVKYGISKEGCLSVSAVNQMLGTSIEDKGTENNSQRKLCSCYGGKVDALQYNANCASHCVYCYAKHENDAALQYYNPDGSLKINKWTITKENRSTTTTEISPIGLVDIIKLKRLLPYVEEMSTLGRQASINQGLKTNITDFYNFAHNLEIFINRRIPKRFRNSLHFSVDEFLRNENYRRMWIEYGKDERLGISKGFNILEALTLSPNFFNMSMLVPTVKSLLETSQTYKIATQIADYFRETERKRFSENDFDETIRYIQDLRIFNFLKNCDFELDLDQIAEITGKDLELYLRYNSLDRSSVTKLKLNTGLNLASFKLIMETCILPYLKSKYTDNSFIRDLLIQENDRTGVKGIALPIPMMNIDRDESLSARYTKYLHDFNAISNTSLAGIKIGDLFFLYNLIVNKNQFGQQSFTRIFEDLINNQDVPKYIGSYYEYSSSTEKDGEIDGFSVGDLAYRLVKYSKGTKIETSRNIIKKLPPDLTLDLPFLFGEYNLFDTQQNKYRWSKLQNLDPGDVIETLVNALNKTGQKIEVITDENVKEKNLPKERGFIKDGVIYINKSRFNDASSLLGVGIHELSHAILAAIKTSDKEIKQRYYDLLGSLKDDPEFETIAAMYPDRVGSDLLEEVFCNKLEKLLMNKISQDSNIELAIINDGLLLKGLKTLFKSDDIEKIEDGLFTPITNLLEFASEMFNFDNPISSDFTTASQKLAELKTRLFNSKEDKFKLDQVCE